MQLQLRTSWKGKVHGTVTILSIIRGLLSFMCLGSCSWVACALATREFRRLNLELLLPFGLRNPCERRNMSILSIEIIYTQKDKEVVLIVKITTKRSFWYPFKIALWTHLYDNILFLFELPTLKWCAKRY